MSSNLLFANDKPGQHADSYYKASANQLPQYSTLQGAHHCDVCVIGAGYTGLSSALHLASKGFNVILLEAHRIGWGASGRNGGQVASGQRAEQDELEASVGLEHARQLWQLAEESKQLVKDLVAQHDIQCDLKPGVLHVDHKKRYVPHSRAYAEKLQKEYDYADIRFVDTEELRDMLATQAYYGGTIDKGAAHLHPLNYALGLGKAAEDAGVSIFENAQVLDYRDGEKVRIRTALGEVEANTAIFACNGYLERLNDRVASRVMPINNFIIATEPLDEATARSLIRDDVAVADSKFVINFYRLSADRRLLFGGNESYGYKFPQDIKAFVRKPMLKIYPQLENTGIDYGWGGTLGVTLNRMPFFERLQGNLFNASGFSGHGVAMATLAGKLMAEAVDGTMGRFDIMAKVPTHPFPGGTHLRSPLLVLGMLYYRIRDSL
ncbi:MAG: FAD-binding oxidoreductase [Gammaproteobacteria bacterium]|nr:FAD-binding oxidoreductase [Gammaproteobacteria bacterium]